jgi:hypothetical protein
MKPSGPSSSVVAAAIVGILLSLFIILGTLGAIAGFAMIPSTSSTAIPPFARSMLIAILLLMAGVAIFGIFTCMGLLRLKNWARVSMLIWGGVMTAFSGLMFLFTSLVPLPEMSADPAASLPYMRLLMAVMYGFQFLIAVWWLVLFNQRTVKEQFLPVATNDDQPLSTPQPRCPLPLAILAGFSIFSAAFSLFLPFTNLPVNPIVFGYRFQGVLGMVVFYISAALVLAGAIGMLRLKRWSYPLMLGLYFFWLASGTVTLARPNFDRNLQEIGSQMNLPEGPMGQAAFAETRVFGILSFIPGVLLIWLLLYCHTRFVEACAAKEAQQRA